MSREDLDHGSLDRVSLVFSPSFSHDTLMDRDEMKKKKRYSYKFLWRWVAGVTCCDRAARSTVPHVRFGIPLGFEAWVRLVYEAWDFFSNVF